MNVFDVIYYNEKKLLNFRNDVIKVIQVSQHEILIYFIGFAENELLIENFD